MSHDIKIVSQRSDGVTTYVGVCSCGRYSTKPYKIRTDAQDAGDAHMVRGDSHNRAIAQFQRGHTAKHLKSELKWYEEQADNPMNSPSERETWAGLASELRTRMNGSDESEQQALF